MGKADRMLQRRAEKEAQDKANKARLAEFEHGKSVARNNLWPVVIQFAKDAKHAENTLQILKNVIQQMMQVPYRTMTIDGLKVSEELTKEKNAEDREFHAALIEAIKGESIPSAMRLLDGMAGSINGVTMKRAGAIGINELKAEDIIN